MCATFDPHELMDKIAFVFQTNRLFSRTLEENVRAARPDATREQVLAALRAAQCDDIVAKLPQGLDTHLGAGGAYLSGGEVQRVALARAILKDAPIVVLDEATAFADPENEALIQRAFAKLAENRTVIIESPTGSRRRWEPTRSWCSTKAAWPSAARTPSCSRPAGCMPPCGPTTSRRQAGR